MALQLVPVLIDAAKEIGAAMHVQHRPPLLLLLLLLLLLPGRAPAQLDPFGGKLLLAPQPPLAVRQATAAVVGELGTQQLLRPRQTLNRHNGGLGAHPRRCGHPQGREGL